MASMIGLVSVAVTEDSVIRRKHNIRSSIPSRLPELPSL